MISMRYHIVSLAAIFLALALGIVLGATKVSSPILAGLQSDKTSLSTEKDQLAEQNTTLTGRVSGDDKFAGSVGTLAVRGTLPNATVVLITTSDADPGDRDAVLSMLARSGAKVTAQLQVTAQFSDPTHASDLRALAAKVLPTGAKLPDSPKAGAVAGGLLAAVLLTDSTGKTATKPVEATAALAALASSGFINASGAIAPGRLVIILTGAAITGGSEADRMGPTDLAGIGGEVHELDVVGHRRAVRVGVDEEGLSADEEHPIERIERCAHPRGRWGQHPAPQRVRRWEDVAAIERAAEHRRPQRLRQLDHRLDGA